MSDYEAAAHCRYRIRYHIVWIVKRRREILFQKELMKRLTTLLYQIGADYEIPIEELGIDNDHLHVFCMGIPSLSPSKIVQIFKSISARELLKEFPWIRKVTHGAGLWGIGYYLATVGHNSFENAVKAYVHNQGKNKDMVTYTQLKLV